jgi:signal transduction histidine kinase
METGGRQVEQDPAARTEVLHASERTRVTRVFVLGSTIIRKQPLGADARQRLHHEVAMLGRLRGVAGVAQLTDAPCYPDSIVLVDVAGASLGGAPKPLAVEEVVALGLQLARAVGDMHRRGVMHRDIAPANIVVAHDGAACLVDFALATPLGEIRPDFMHHSEIVGTLAYVAPEQTGRTGRSVDQRSDLYALGGTLYELATGAPPFGSADALQLTHDHLARVPVAPGEANPAVPAALSDVILHLLEKEPDHRYQSAEGLVRDLERLKARPAPSALKVGEHDFPLRLRVPSRLIGREAEVAALDAAFSASRSGACRGVLIGGSPGVGKTALADALRPVVTNADGRFVAGKFDQFRRDLEFDAMNQALRALGRLLLPEPEAELAAVRERILRAVGANAALLTATVHEFAALLDVRPDAGDPLTAQTRAQQSTLQVLEAVASRDKPLVVFVDDLQWAGRTPLGVVDLVLSEEPVDGLLLVAAYREGDLDPATVSRWRDQAGVQHLELGDLRSPDLLTVIAEMLRTDRTAAAELADLIEPHSRGNPYETVELLDALHRDGLLTATARGWRWEAAAVRAHLEDEAGLAAARAGSMPAQAHELLEAMACLGGRAELSLLQAATGEPEDEVERRLAPAVDEGLLAMEPGAHPAVRFRHDRIREAILRRLDLPRRRHLELAGARRLGRVPELFAVAAEQYLPVIDQVSDAGERRVVVALLRRAADQAALIGDYLRVNMLLAAALDLVDPADHVTVAELRTGRQAALFSLGRLEEADAEYRRIEQLCPSALERAGATAVQVRSLSHATRFAEAIELGLHSLRECGIAVPAESHFADDLDRGFGRLYAWLDGTDPADDLARPELSDPALLAATRLIDALLPAAYFVADAALIAWLALEALRIWIDHGPGATVVGPAGHAAYHAGPQRGENAAAYRALQRIVALGEARGYEPGTSQARHMLAAMTGWFEPIENGVRAARRAREGLIAGADLAYAGYTYQLSVPYSVDCAPSLTRFRDEVDAGLAFLRRTGNEQTSQWLDSYQWLIRVLLAESATAAGEPVPVERYADSPLALLYAHLCHALACAVFGDAPGLAQHSAAAMQLLPAAAGFYSIAQVRLLRGLALAEQARDADGDEHAGLVSELEEVTRWFAACAEDASDNFVHILRLLEAEQAWARGDFRAAALAFDTARREVAERPRPWHRALIAERAAQFHLAHGLRQAGRDLLADARRHYLAWGATAKVERMDWVQPAHEPQPPEPGHRRSAVTSGTIDLLGVLSASQALSSETSVERLHSRVVRVLAAMTGATDVNVLLWSEERQAWLLPAHDATGGMTAIGDPEAPESVLRYAQRTREPLVVSDATRDDRFARDPYFAGLARCSLMAVPIVRRGTLKALLLVENRLLGDAFTSERLDVVKLIAGQLAVSLDNAQLYAEHQQIADEQAALRRVATIVAEGREATAVFEAVAAEMQRLLDADGVTLGRYEPDDAIIAVAHRGFEGWQLPVGVQFSHRGDSVTTRVRSTRAPARMNRYELAKGPMAQVVRDLGVRSSVGAPIVLEGRLWGVAVAYWSRVETAPRDSEQRIAHFAQLLETALSNADSRDQLIASRARLLVAGDEARRRVVRDLHDGAQQRLVHVIVTLKLAQQALRNGDDGAVALVDEALEAAQQGNEDLRELAHGILPAILTHAGLQGAVNAIAKRLDLPMHVEIPSERFPAEIEASAYFIVAEALTNIVKHARATRADVRTSVEDGKLRIEVRDDGIGGADTSSHGLVGISDRVAALQGQLELESPPGAGTRVVATLPIPRG